MSDLGQKMLDGYNQLADKIVGWEIEQLSKAVTNYIQFGLTNLDTLLPLLGIVGLFVFKPTKPFAIGSLVAGILLLLGGL